MIIIIKIVTVEDLHRNLYKNYFQYLDIFFYFRIILTISKVVPIKYNDNDNYNYSNTKSYVIDIDDSSNTKSNINSCLYNFNDLNIEQL